MFMKKIKKMSKKKFTAKDRLKREITLTEDRWSHIKDGHPEITSTSMVRNAIINADFIFEDEKMEDVDLYFKFDTTIPGNQLKVVTLINQEEKSGSVITAYPDSKSQAATYPGRKKWPK
jgi:hypothetical protein